MGYSRRWPLFFLLILLWELAKYHVLGTKFRVLLEKKNAFNRTLSINRYAAVVGALDDEEQAETW
jgi:hypothetical protein